MEALSMLHLVLEEMRCIKKLLHSQRWLDLSTVVLVQQITIKSRSQLRNQSLCRKQMDQLRSRESQRLLRLLLQLRLNLLIHGPILVINQPDRLTKTPWWPIKQMELQLPKSFAMLTIRCKMLNLVPIVIVASKNVSKETLLLLNSKTETSSQNVVNAILETLLDVQVVHTVEFQLLKKVIK